MFIYNKKCDVNQLSIELAEAGFTDVLISGTADQTIVQLSDKDSAGKKDPTAIVNAHINENQKKINILNDKKKQGKLTLDDIYEQNQLIIELLTQN